MGKNKEMLKFITNGQWSLGSLSASDVSKNINMSYKSPSNTVQMSEKEMRSEVGINRQQDIRVDKNKNRVSGVNKGEKVPGAKHVMVQKPLKDKDIKGPAEGPWSIKNPAVKKAQEAMWNEMQQQNITKNADDMRNDNVKANDPVKYTKHVEKLPKHPKPTQIMDNVKASEDAMKGEGGESKHDRCIEHVKGKVNNPHAVCVAAGVRPAKWKHISKEEALKIDHNGQWSMNKANPDKEEDADLGEEVEQLVERHAKKNKAAERKEGHELLGKTEYIHGLPSNHPALGRHAGHIYRRTRPPIKGDNTWQFTVRSPDGKDSKVHLPESTGGTHDAIRAHIDSMKKEENEIKSPIMQPKKDSTYQPPKSKSYTANAAWLSRQTNKK